MVHIQVVLGSTREGRFGERAAAWTMARLGERDDMTVELVDLRDHELPWFEGTAPARHLRDYPNEDLARLGRMLDRADGYVVVSPEYNHGYPGALKNAIDFTFIEWTRKPMAFVGWGQVGGARAIEQLRLVAVELEMAPLRHAVHILPDVLLPALRAEVFEPELLDPLLPRLTTMADDLVWWAEALAAARTAVPDPR
jgi:NAD(P)H-dependent FMN reductase